jgi:hypothetical protein
MIDELLPRLCDFLKMVDPESACNATEILSRFTDEEELFIWLNEKYGHQYNANSDTWRPNRYDKPRLNKLSDQHSPSHKDHDSASDAVNSDTEESDHDDDHDDYDPSDDSSYDPSLESPAESKPPAKKLRTAAGTGSAGSDDEKKKPSKPVCMYGTACYRRNPQHFSEFAHPWRSDIIP